MNEINEKWPTMISVGHKINAELDKTALIPLMMSYVKVYALIVSLSLSKEVLHCC